MRRWLKHHPKRHPKNLQHGAQDDPNSKKTSMMKSIVLWDRFWGIWVPILGSKTIKNQWFLSGFVKNHVFGKNIKQMSDMLIDFWSSPEGVRDIGPLAGVAITGGRNPPNIRL